MGSKSTFNWFADDTFINGSIVLQGIILCTVTQGVTQIKKKKRRFTLYKLFSGSDICPVTNEKWKHDYKSMRIYIQKDRK